MAAAKLYKDLFTGEDERMESASYIISSWKTVKLSSMLPVCKMLAHCWKISNKFYH